MILESLKNIYFIKKKIINNVDLDKSGTDEENVLMNAFKLFDTENKGLMHRDM